MKQTSIKIAVFLVLAGCASQSPTVTGKWKARINDSTVTELTFTLDNKFSWEAHGLPTIAGTFSIDNKQITFVENGMEKAQHPIYKPVFFAKDSMRLEVVEDSLKERRDEVVRLRFGK